MPFGTTLVYEFPQSSQRCLDPQTGFSVERTTVFDIRLKPTQTPVVTVRRATTEWNEERLMNWDQIQGNWEQFKGKAQQQWGKLTDDDMDVIQGKRTELVGRLQERYGYAKEQAEREVDNFCNSCG